MGYYDRAKKKSKEIMELELEPISETELYDEWNDWQEEKVEKAEKEQRGLERLIKDLGFEPKRKVLCKSLVDHSLPWNEKPEPEKPVNFFKSYDRPRERSVEFRKSMKRGVRKVREVKKYEVQ